MHHYRCFKCYIPSTAKEIISDTVKLIPKKLSLPQIDMNIYLQLAVEKIIKLLETNNHQHNQMKLNNQYDLLQSFKNVAHILNPPTLPQQHVLPPPRVPTTLQQMLKTLKQQQAPNPMPAIPRVNTYPVSDKRTPMLPRVQQKYLFPSKSLSHFPMRAIQPTYVLPTRSYLNTKANRHKQIIASQIPSLPIPPPLPSPIVSHNINHVYDSQGKKMSIDRLITQEDTKQTWLRALNNELGRLANGYKANDIVGTNTLSFISKKKTYLMEERLHIRISFVTLDL